MTVTIPYDFKPYPYQLNLLKALDSGKKNAYIVWSRRSGKDYTCLQAVIKLMLQRVGTYVYCYPTFSQGKRNMWDAITNDGKKYMDSFPPEIVEAINKSELSITLKNGSRFQIIGSDNYDTSLIGSNPVCIVFSEYALSDSRAYDLVKPILAANDGICIINSTPRGANDAKKLWDRVKDDPKWFTELLTAADCRDWNGNRLISEERIEEDIRNGLPRELALQEYYCSWAGGVVGAYFSEQIQRAKSDKRITRVPYEPTLPVYVAFDLGMDDSTTMWFIQVIRKEFRVIDYYENTGKGLSFYAGVLKEKKYVYETLYLPHDAAIRDMSGDGKTRAEILEGFGFHTTIVPRASNNDVVIAHIQVVRDMLSSCWFDAHNCERGIIGLESYSADYNEKLKILSNRPRHDIHSHAADAFRCFAIGYQPKVDSASLITRLRPRRGAW